jgi:hypothetical protein
MKLTTHLHKGPRPSKVELHLHSPFCLHGIVLKPKDNFTISLENNRAIQLEGMDSSRRYQINLYYKV